MNSIEKETLRRISKMGFNIPGLLDPVIALPPSLYSKFSKVEEEVEAEGGEEDTEE